MIADLPSSAGAGMIWPCGPECRHARALAGTYGEWLWCDDPKAGGCIVRAGHECAYYNPIPNPPRVQIPAAKLK
jgi:hypothetical protein